MVTEHAIDSRCPVCWTAQSFAADITPVADRGPQAGDVVMCANCGTVLMFDDDALRLRQPSESEMHAWPVGILIVLLHARVEWRKAKARLRGK